MLLLLDPLTQTTCNKLWGIFGFILHDFCTSREMHVIPEDVILRMFNSEESPQTACLDGSPGAGKTTFMRHLVHKWSEDFLKLEGDPIILDRESGPFSLMVFLSTRAIKGSVKKAIRDALWCKPEDKDLLVAHIETGEGVAIMLDALDEVRNDSVLQELDCFVQEAQNGHYSKVLLSTRTDICKIDRALFDRTLVLHGFTQPQTTEYVNKYFPEPEPPAEPHPILNYIKENRIKLQPVLSNPLKLHILCELVSRGMLELGPDETLDIVKLFRPLERFLIKREIERNCQQGTENIRLQQEETEREAENFYRLCFYGMINDIREFSENLLNAFNINNIYRDIFLAKDTELSIETNQEQGRTFQHEILYEYFASCYIESASRSSLQVMLLAVCLRVEFRNIQKIVFELLSKIEMYRNMLEPMIRGMLMLQHTEERKKKVMQQLLKFKLIKNVKSIQMSVKKNFPGSKVLQSPLDGELHYDFEAEKIWYKIEKCFDEHADDLRTLDWFADLEKNGTICHVVDCLNACSPEQQKHIVANSLHLLLPCTFKDSG